MADVFAQLSPWAQFLLDILLTVLKLVGILVGGWIAARLLRRATAAVLKKARFDAWLERLGLVWTDRRGRRRSYSEAVGTAVFYLVLVLVVVLFLDVLDLPMLAGPLRAMLDELGAAVPDLLKAFLILAGAWLLALVLRVVLERVLAGIGFDQWARRFEDEEDRGEEEVARRTPSQIAGLSAFYLVLLLALPAFLDALRLDPLVGPLEEMLTSFFGFLPGLVGAGLILVVGWVVARLLRTIVGQGLAVIGLDDGARRVGIAKLLGDHRLSQIVAVVAYYLVLLVALVAAVEALGLEAISRPVTTMFTTVIDYIPSVLGALVVVMVGVFLGRLVRDFVSDLLSRVGFDDLFARLGLPQLEPRQETYPPSRIAGMAAMAVVVLLFVAEGLELLGLRVLSGLFSEFLAWLPQFVLALVIVGGGFAVAGWVRGIVSGSVPETHRGAGRFLGEAARWTILVFAFAMALQQVGIGQAVVEDAFVILFGAVSLALALAFGLGGREVAAGLIRKWSEGSPPRDDERSASDPGPVPAGE